MMDGLWCVLVALNPRTAKDILVIRLLLNTNVLYRYMFSFPIFFKELSLLLDVTLIEGMAASQFPITHITIKTITFLSTWERSINSTSLMRLLTVHARDRKYSKQCTHTSTMEAEVESLFTSKENILLSPQVRLTTRASSYYDDDKMPGRCLFDSLKGTISACIAYVCTSRSLANAWDRHFFLIVTWRSYSKPTILLFCRRRSWLNAQIP